MAKVKFRYANGRTQVMDRRYAKVLSALGRGTYLTRDMRAAEPAGSSVDELMELRAQYQAVVGKRPYHGWDVDELRKRITEAGDQS